MLPGSDFMLVFELFLAEFVVRFGRPVLVQGLIRRNKPARKQKQQHRVPSSIDAKRAMLRRALGRHELSQLLNHHSYGS